MYDSLICFTNMHIYYIYRYGGSIFNHISKSNNAKKTLLLAYVRRTVEDDDSANVSFALLFLGINTYRVSRWKSEGNGGEQQKK